MRRIVLSFSLFVLTIATANAQDFRVGISGGIDAARMAISGASGGPLLYKSEVSGGIVGELGISKHLLYNWKVIIHHRVRV